MLAISKMAAPIGYLSTTVALFSANSVSKISYPPEHPNFPFHQKTHISLSLLSTSPLHFTRTNSWTHFSPKAATSPSVGNAEYTEEPATSVKFLKSLYLSDCSRSLSLLGTGYREKVFAIIGVKVYAAGLYVNPSLLNDLNPWKGKSPDEVQKDLALFQTIYQSSLEKALQIVLVRDVDGKTFWDALDEAISPRVTAPTPVDDSALATFRSIFQGRSLKKGTSIFLTWLEPSKMLVSVSMSGLPTKADATIDSMNVTRALFDVFLGESAVSPTLKTSVASGLASSL